MQADHALGFNGAGLGLGLTVVDGLVKAHGGLISVTIEGLSRGACFRVILPLDGPAERPRQRRGIGRERHRRALNVGQRRPKSSRRTGHPRVRTFGLFRRSEPRPLCTLRYRLKHRQDPACHADRSFLIRCANAPPSAAVLGIQVIALAKQFFPESGANPRVLTC